MTRDEGAARSGPQCSATGDDCLPSVASEALFRGRRELGIVHRGDRYLLRITRQGKLILNKTGKDDDAYGG
jgi:hemin uptake protein HemP